MMLMALTTLFKVSIIVDCHACWKIHFATVTSLFQATRLPDCDVVISFVSSRAKLVFVVISDSLYFRVFLSLVFIIVLFILAYCIINVLVP